MQYYIASLVESQELYSFHVNLRASIRRFAGHFQLSSSRLLFIAISASIFTLYLSGLRVHYTSAPGSSGKAGPTGLQIQPTRAKAISKEDIGKVRGARPLANANTIWQALVDSRGDTAAATKAIPLEQQPLANGDAMTDISPTHAQ